jgi:uncharacterized membrane protein
MSRQTPRPYSNGTETEHRPGSDPAERNIRAIADLEREALHERTTADRIGDVISAITGSVPFGVVHALWFLAWGLINTGTIPGIEPFDPFPFGFLTLVVSLEAIFLSVFVLMSQNRMTRQADKRAHLDLQIDLLAEQELTTILHMLGALCKKQGVDVDVPSERMRQQLEDTDIHSLASTLNKRLPEQ